MPRLNCHKYTREQDEFILNNGINFPKAKVKEFNDKFSLALSKSSLVQRFKTLKIRENSTVHKVYNERELDYLLSIYEKYKGVEYDWNGCLKDFNNFSGRNMKIPTFKNIFYHVLGINVGRTTKQPPNTTKIGESIVQRGKEHIRISNTKGAGMKNYKQKNRYMYEQYHNVVLKSDEYIVHLDGDYRNFEKDNLYKITKDELHYVKHDLDYANNEHINADIKKILLLDAQLRAIIDREEKENEKHD